VGYIEVDVTTTQSHKRKGTGPMKKVRFLGLDVHAETGFWERVLGINNERPVVEVSKQKR
jgi:hypothetical protein